MWRPLPWVTFLLMGQAWANEPVVKAIVVPRALAEATSNPELSGIVWSPPLQRYLLVTDDSGLRSKGTSHEPLLLGLGQDGALDEDPIPIHGAESINDPESICAGPPGTYFLVTSHSPNRANETKPSRRQLLLLKERKRALQVTARLDLTKLHGNRSLLELAGLPPAGRLDVEAIAYRDGALFIGFKSPLTDRGEAVIVRIAGALEALRRGQVDGKQVARYLAAPLCVGEKDRQVCQGISDMVFLGDGSLVVAANAPKGGPKDHGGSLWHWPAPLGKAGPILLHRFPGLKPEGVTLSGSGRALAVVFDCDDATPRWTEVPIPAPR